MPKNLKRTGKSQRTGEACISLGTKQNGDEGYDTWLFNCFANSKLWNNFSSQSIITGRRVVLGPQHRFLLTDYVRDMHWEGLLNIPSRVYPQLVKFFYSNLAVIEDPKGYYLGSFVKGKPILLSVSDIAQILGIPQGDPQDYFWDADDLREMVDENVFYETLTRDCLFRGALHSRDLLLKYRVLIRFLVENVVPKGGHYDDLTSFQSYVLYKIVTHGSLSLPFVLMKEMDDDAQSFARSLSFGAFLTKVFRHFGVSLKDETELVLKNLINKTTISHMKLSKLIIPNAPRVDAPIQGENLTVTGGVTPV
ncbi:hypothetical protein Vadar_022892 [Vaccinium darrowii]|uniref:Uncharacterized protein n=1 Tax=Vaccinium darrowii TaxID=229202 RepID=A0ACB7Y897_9ERIC|nr:hypothetical protein Vadar_022892 [Vaccinium darrowii]